MKDNMDLSIQELDFSFEKRKIIEDIELNVKEGEFVGIIGPNGSGKSTILKNVYRSLEPEKGTVFLNGEELGKISYKEMARKLGVVGQENYVPFDFKVEDIVAMGRSPHKKLFDTDTNEDKKIVMDSLKKIGMEDTAKRSYQHLSGGEKQRVIIARALAQQTKFLILDEPTNHLDIGYQLSTFDLIKRLGVTVLAAIHDLNIAAMYCDRIYVLKDGKMIANGKPEKILTAELIWKVYGVKTDIMIHPKTGKINITYLPECIVQEHEQQVRDTHKGEADE